MTPAGFSVRAGRLFRGEEPTVVHGVVYHPSAAGTAMWRQADQDEIRRDFAAIAGYGFNTVRLFLYWRDAQPTEDEISAEVLGRLRACVDEAARHGLACLVSLLTIFMNGELLDLPWRRGRDLWRHTGMVAAEERYVSAVASALAGSPNLLGFDLGDEVTAVAPTAADTLTADEVAAWYARLGDAIRRHAPGALVCQANNASAVFGPGAFTVASAGRLDINAVHGFPSWAPGSIESSLSVKATNLVPFLASVAGAYKPAIVDELACYGAGEATAAAYLGATAVSCVANGAIGFICWCWQDLVYSGEPFGERPLERYMGLLRADGSGKPTLSAAVAAIQATRAVDRAAGNPVALYLPERLAGGARSYLDADGGAIATFYAYLLLKRAHLQFDVVAGPLDAARRLVVCPGPVHLTWADLDRLSAAARGGATVYLSFGDPVHGLPRAELTGASPVDFTLLPGGHERFAWDGEQWPVAWTRATLPALTVEAPAASVLARFCGGSPALVEHRVGAGRVIFCAAPFERQLDQPGRLAARPWHRLYARIAALSGASPSVWCDEPDVELVTLRGGRRVLAVNHRADEVVTEVSWRDPAARHVMRLPGKGWVIADDAAGV